ncbi:mechanosensitive ion channel family protein [Jannaschia sp. LMIT008]|uniref:mechanosensitive ion channel family protein n=1 Tax=Jannaschia maritima TaxID=3032585 RepID=UPI002811B6B0|nr:mechanosensitive ion channel family protein [Jannaschia sp. LMIT008]
MLRGTIVRLLACLVLLTAWAPPVAAQDDSVEVTTPADPFGRDTPRGTVDGLIAAFASGDRGDVIPYLDLSDLPPERHRFEGRRIGDRLQTVLDATGGILPAFRLSDEPQGTTGDGLAPDLDRFALLRAEDGPVDLTLIRSEVDGVPVWRVSPAALALVSATEFRIPLYQRLAPDWLDGTLGGVPQAAWVALAATGFVALAVAYVVVWLAMTVLRLTFRRLGWSGAWKVIRPLRVPLTLAMGAPMFTALNLVTGVPIVARAAVGPVVETGSWLALAWTGLRLVHAIGDEVLASMTRRSRVGAISVVSMARRIAYAVVAVVAALMIASSFGLDLTGWFAALGIGGIAVALGAQKTIEHIVGGLSLIADQPVRVGDFCSVGGLMGTVEDIGLRSTRLRTLDNTLLTIPNGDMAAARIENFAGRRRFNWTTILGLRYETTPDQMRAVLWRLEQLLAGDERVDEGFRARFVGFGPSSLDIEIFAYLLADSQPAQLAVRQDLNLAIMDIVGECGTGFAFPSQTVYLARDDKPAAGDEAGFGAPVRDAAE